jgi:hypothetical protein
MNGNPGVEPQLSPDFAMRVLEAAERLMAKRRRLRWTAASSVLCVGIAAIAVWLDFTAASRGPAPEREPMVALAGAPQIFEGPRPNSSGALSYFFPDAGPLARYAAEDAPDDSGGSAGALFADED